MYKVYSVYSSVRHKDGCDERLEHIFDTREMAEESIKNHVEKAKNDKFKKIFFLRERTVYTDKITIEEYTQFTINYFVIDKYKFLRFGQAFMCEFFPHKSDPKLFYEVDNQKSREIILRKYIKEDEYTGVYV